MSLDVIDMPRIIVAAVGQVGDSNMRSISLEQVVFATYFIGFVVALARFACMDPRAFRQMLQDPERFARAGVTPSPDLPKGAESLAHAAAIAAE